MEAAVTEEEDTGTWEEGELKEFSAERVSSPGEETGDSEKVTIDMIPKWRKAVAKLLHCTVFVPVVRQVCPTLESYLIDNEILHTLSLPMLRH